MVVPDNEAGNIYRHRVQLPQEERQAGRISGNHVGDYPLGRMGWCNRTILPQWEAWPSSHGNRENAADVSASDLV